MTRMFRPIALTFVLALVSQACAQSAASLPAQRANIAAEMNEAIEKVDAIVNQPVEPLLQTANMNVTTYRPGWFHEGASKPTFNVVDVRKTQDLQYGKHEYVTSDLNPGIVFRGSDVEFNGMLKYFYSDRHLPKKKLTEEEMLEINRLYRIIGRCEGELPKL
jgi:hypothetical protein